MIQHPYENLKGGRWLMGNLHTHTTASDGRREHQAVIDDYAGRGYGFLMISDHDILTNEETYSKLESHGMVLISGNEITAHGPHMLHVGAESLVEPHSDRQKVIDEIEKSGGFVIFNHPNWVKNFSHCPQELLGNSSGYIGLEIYNGVISRLDGSPYATNRWDMLLSQGRKLWGFANDDSHEAEGDVGLGWNMVYVHDETPEGITNALRQGRFYASSGVEISEIIVENNRISLQTENASRIVAIRDTGRRVATTDTHSIEIDVPSGARYVRFECWGAGEAFAWTQPFYISE
jgi:hypothetical protein